MRRFWAKLWWILLPVGMILGLGPRTACASQADDFKGSIVSAIQLEEGVVGGGLLSEKGIGIAAKKGYRTVIDLRTPEEGTAGEKLLVEKYGLRYVNIPVTTPTVSQAKELKVILLQDGAKPAILHCRSGRRVKALWAIYKKLR
ncbi:MAG: sulfur transferase domain-containing protein [Candidatus Omnitrophota bacterium]